MADWQSIRGVVRFAQPISTDEMSALVHRGLHVACASYGDGTTLCAEIFAVAREVFRAMNHPVGLMLEGATDCLAESWRFACEHHADFFLFPAECADVMPTEVSTPALCARVTCAADADRLARLPLRGVLLTDWRQDLLPAVDAWRAQGVFVWLEADALGWTGQAVDGIVSAPERFDMSRAVVPTRLSSVSTVQREIAPLLNQELAALMVLTTDGDNVRRIASLYPNAPLIAIARRPVYERLLLSLIAHWQVVPTAITTIPPASERLDFAAYITGLYGFTSGRVLVCGQCWEELTDQAPCVIDLAAYAARSK